MADHSLKGRASEGDPVAQVALAEALDARGAHAEAIEWLARAARANHAPALRLLGIRLSTGHNAPGLPLQGADLIRLAGRLGDGEALALLAVFAGVGYLQPSDWAQALASLKAAAANGWQPAREHLALLSAGPAGLAPADASVDIGAWQRPPEPDVLSLSPRIASFPGLIPHAVCDALIERSRKHLVRARVFDPISGDSIIEKTRTNRVATISLFESDLLHIVVQARLAAVAAVPMRALEAASILNYRVGEAAHEHFDFIDPGAPGYAAETRQLGQRVATALVYLNEEYEGGETVFPELGISYRGRKGDALLFFSVTEQGQPDRRTVHAGRPPSAGQKWLFSQFIRRPPGT